MILIPGCAHLFQFFHDLVQNRCHIRPIKTHPRSPVLKFLGLRKRGEPDWLDAAPFGLVLGVVLIPPIAVLAKRDFALSRDLAHALIERWLGKELATSLRQSALAR